MANIQVPVTISDQRPEQCDSDLMNVCDSISYQNSKGNLLVRCEIKGNQIILEYDEYKIQKK